MWQATARVQQTLATLYIPKYNHVIKFACSIPDITQNFWIKYKMYSIPLPVFWWPMAVETMCIFRLLYPHYPSNRRLGGYQRHTDVDQWEINSLTSIKYNSLCFRSSALRLSTTSHIKLHTRQTQPHTLIPQKLSGYSKKLTTHFHSVIQCWG